MADRDGTDFADRVRLDAASERRQQPLSAQTRELIALIRRTNITVSQPAHIQPPVWSDPVDLSERVSVPAAVNAYQKIIEFTAPPGRWCRISTYGVNVLDPAYTYNGSILWRLTKNGLPLGQGLSNWGIQRGSIVEPRQVMIILEEGDTIAFEVRRAVAAAGAQNVELALQGWTWRLRNNFEGTAGSITAY